MNEKKTNSPNGKQYPDMSKEEQERMLGKLCLLLASALDAHSKEAAWVLLNDASKKGHILNCPAFNTLYGAVASEVTMEYMRKENSKHE